MSKITPVILSGGTGSRLWPLSRKSYPKQFANLIGTDSLFQKCALRMESSDLLTLNKPIIVTNHDYRFIIGDQLHQIAVDVGAILIEPCAKNTAPAILAASLFALQEDAEAILLVAPSDQIMSDKKSFHKAVESGLPAVNKGNIVTFGIKPAHPETGYGYLEVSEVPNGKPQKLVRFKEKPELLEASLMVDSGNFLWNSGVFLFQAKTILKAFQQYCPDMIEVVRSAIEEGTSDLDFFRLDPAAWNNCEDVSVDYAVMEKSNNLVVVPYDQDWSDLGSWNAVLNEMGPDHKGVATSENAHAFDCENTLLRSESAQTILVGLGLDNIIAIAMPDAVLIAHRDQAQNIGKIVSDLNVNGILQAEQFPKEHRPWGWFETIATGDRFKVKKILVTPGGSLSLQSHLHRSEYWVVVEGTAKVTLNDEEKLLTEGGTIYIPTGCVHRLENPGKLPMILVEVQSGAYLGEDDIVRYEDIYSRI